jgi:radical SAM superfamily enzyme YgiQ (UPF0313 family)
VKEAYKAGWRGIKLYFMCGFPGERENDIDGIVHLSRKVSEARRDLGKGPANVNASVGWLVPKPYTPFQWAAQPRAEYFHEARRRMASLLYADLDKNKSRKWGNKKGKSMGPIKLKTHNVERSILEAVFARGDRRLAGSIEHAYRAGARFDGWDECFKSQLWNDAFVATSTDPDFYAHRERGQQEVFPWTHLHGGPEQDYLARQYDDAFTQIGMRRPEPALA